MEKRKLMDILLALGLLVSIYLTITHFYPGTLACPTTGVINCESVLTSQYSNIFGVPAAVFALVLFGLGYIMLFKDDTMKFLWCVAGAGAVIYSIGSQLLLGLVCIYCLTLDLIIIAVIFLSNSKK